MIKAETLKEVKEQIALPLVHLINKVISTGSCPSEFKVAIIKPLYKNGDKNIVSNYRPISLITNLTKIFEKVIKIRIVNYLNKYKLISENQFGFREGRST